MTRSGLLKLRGFVLHGLVLAAALFLVSGPALADKRVALILGNSIEMALALFAAHAAGAQAVPINPAYTARELDLIIADAAPRLAIVDAATSAAAAPVLERNGGARSLLVGPGGLALDQWRSARGLALPKPPAPDDLATFNRASAVPQRPPPPPRPWRTRKAPTPTSWPRWLRRW